MLVVALLPRVVGAGPLGSLVTLVVGGLLLIAGYLLAARRLRVREVDEVISPVLRRLGRA